MAEGVVESANGTASPQACPSPPAKRSKSSNDSTDPSSAHQDYAALLYAMLQKQQQQPSPPASAEPPLTRSDVADMLAAALKPITDAQGVLTQLIQASQLRIDALETLVRAVSQQTQPATSIVTSTTPVVTPIAGMPKKPADPPEIAAEKQRQLQYQQTQTARQQQQQYSTSPTTTPAFPNQHQAQPFQQDAYTGYRTAASGTIRNDRDRPYHYASHYGQQQSSTAGPGTFHRANTAPAAPFQQEAYGNYGSAAQSAVPGYYHPSFPMSYAEYEEMRNRTRKCYVCRRKGHFAKDCPMSPNNNPALAAAVAEHQAAKDAAVAAATMGGSSSSTSHEQHQLPPTPQGPPPPAPTNGATHQYQQYPNEQSPSAIGRTSNSGAASPQHASSAAAAASVSPTNPTTTITSQANPENLTQLLQDPVTSQLLSTILGVNVNSVDARNSLDVQALTEMLRAVQAASAMSGMSNTDNSKTASPANIEAAISEIVAAAAAGDVGQMQGPSA